MNCPKCGTEIKNISNNKKCIVSILLTCLIILAGIIIYFCLSPMIFLGNHGTAYLANNIIKDVEINNAKKPLDFGNKYTLTNKNLNVEIVDMSFEIDRIILKYSDLDNLVSIDIPVLNAKTKDLRIVNFVRNGAKLNAQYKIK